MAGGNTPLVCDQCLRLAGQLMVAQARIAVLERVMRDIDGMTFLFLGHLHWDSTMRHGTGCEKCIEQRETRDEIHRKIEDSLAALDAKEEP